MSVEYIRVIRESGGLGDSTRVLAVCQGMRLKYPAARIHYFGAGYLRHLFQDRSDAFDVFFPCECNARPRDCYDYTCKHLNPHGIHYDITIDCWCPAYLHEPATEGICCQDRTEIWCKNGNVPVTRPRLELLTQDYEVKAWYKKQYHKIIGIQPGATCPSREWPYPYWNELVKMLKEIGVHVILFDVCRRTQGEIDYSLLETSICDDWHKTLGRMAACDLIITPDSGFYHLAGAIGAKTLGIFGCTSGQIMSRPWQMEEYTHHYLQLRHDQIDASKLPKDCQPICYMQWCRGWSADRYRKQQGRGYCAIIEQITPEMVFQKVMELL